MDASPTEGRKSSGERTILDVAGTTNPDKRVRSSFALQFSLAVVRRTTHSEQFANAERSARGSTMGFGPQSRPRCPRRYSIQFWCKGGLPPPVAEASVAWL